MLGTKANPVLPVASEELGSLEAARWPVLMVDSSGAITSLNQNARDTFGITAPGAFSSIWATDNGCPADQFLRQLETSSSSTFPVRLRTTQELSRPYSLGVCAGSQGEARRFILQCFSRPAKPTVEAPRPVETIEVKPAVAPASGATHQQRLICALQLTRTVAMDFNNALTSILGHASHLLSRLPPDSPWRTSLEQIEKSAERGTQIAYDLAAFSRDEKEIGTGPQGNLNKLVRGVVDRCKSRAAPGVQWRLLLEPKLSSATFSDVKLAQALEKILDNALDAVASAGTITITTENRLVTDSGRDSGLLLRPGHYLSLAINDTGGGISADALPLVMDPFFTTKPGHRGLGLAWAYGLVTNHGGSLTITSRAGQGTTAQIFLPAAGDAIEERVLSEAELRGDQTILVVDDESLMLTMGDMVLASFGYRVLTASNGRQALETIRASDTKIDLVITDLVMPHMDGHALIRELRANYPDIPIICSSGNFRPTSDVRDITYLQKPFTTTDLMRAVRSALGRTTSAGETVFLSRT